MQLAIVYDLLSQLWLEPLSLIRLQALVNSELGQVIESLGGSMPEQATEDIANKLSNDYGQLFKDSEEGVSPVQSTWTTNPDTPNAPSHEARSNSASSCEEFYRTTPEYQPPELTSDHLAVQFNFLAYLFHAAAEGNQTSAHLEIATEFYGTHLGWTAPLLETVKKRANTDFYRGLARITEVFLQPV